MIEGNYWLSLIIMDNLIFFVLPVFSKFFTMRLLCYERENVGYQLRNDFLVPVLAPPRTV